MITYLNNIVTTWYDKYKMKLCTSKTHNYLMSKSNDNFSNQSLCSTYIEGGGAIFDKN